MSQIRSRRASVAQSLSTIPIWALGLSPASVRKVSSPFSIGMITDEITQDFDQAAGFLKSFSLTYGRGRVPFAHKAAHLLSRTSGEAVYLLVRRLRPGSKDILGVLCG